MFFVLLLLGALFGSPAFASPAFTSTTLAVKFVELAPGGVPAITRAQAQDMIRSINHEYAQCGLALVLGQYISVDPTARGLPYQLNSMDELDNIRSAFSDPRYLVVIDTGPWDHSRMGPANAWTAMPGEKPAGAVLEGSVAGDAPIVAHELGHYLGLEHVSDASDMMNPVIYSDSTSIFQSQCQQMVQTARTGRPLALR